MGRDSDQTLDPGEEGLQLARLFIDVEGNAGNQSSFDPSLENRRVRTPPRGIDENENVAGSELLGMVGNNWIENRH